MPVLTILTYDATGRILKVRWAGGGVYSYEEVSLYHRRKIQDMIYRGWMPHAVKLLKTFKYRRSHEAIG